MEKDLLFLKGEKGGWIWQLELVDKMKFVDI
jgi:hypothetical protein